MIVIPRYVDRHSWKFLKTRLGECSPLVLRGQATDEGMLLVNDLSCSTLGAEMILRSLGVTVLGSNLI